MVAAFVRDPAFRHFFVDESRFDELAAEFAGFLFDARVAHGTVWVVDDGVAVAMWVPPGADVDDPAGPALPDDVLARLQAYETVVSALMPPRPRWYLGVLATHPRWAGHGLGRLAMAPGLDRAAVDGVPAVLETTNPRNVALYARSGWSQVAYAVVGTLPVWVMRHSGLRGGSRSG